MSGTKMICSKYDRKTDLKLGTVSGRLQLTRRCAVYDTVETRQAIVKDFEDSELFGADDFINGTINHFDFFEHVNQNDSIVNGTVVLTNLDDTISSIYGRSFEQKRTFEQASKEIEEAKELFKGDNTRIILY